MEEIKPYLKRGMLRPGLLKFLEYLKEIGATVVVYTHSELRWASKVTQVMTQTPRSHVRASVRFGPGACGLSLVSQCRACLPLLSCSTHTHTHTGADRPGRATRASKTLLASSSSTASSRGPRPHFLLPSLSSNHSSPPAFLLPSPPLLFLSSLSLSARFHAPSLCAARVAPAGM